MQWEIPDRTATEMAAAYLQAAVTLGLAGLFTFLLRRYRKPYFGWFAIAWAIYALRLFAIVSFLRTENWSWLYWHQVITGWTALALLWSALVFSEQLRWRNRYLAIVLFPPLWSYLAIYQLDNFLLAAGPAVAFLSGATLWTGWTFFRHYRRVGATAAMFLAVAFLLWGLHHLDYPFLRERGAWNPWGYYLDILFALVIGAGMLLLVLEDLQRGVESLSALSAELQRRGPEEEVLDALLETTLTLSSVRGSAMYLRDERGGRVVRGVGYCADWQGRPVGPSTADAITRVFETGRPVTVSDAGALNPDQRHPFVAALPILRKNAVTGALIMVGHARDPFAALDSRFLVALGQQVGAALENADLDRRLGDRTETLERLATRMVQQHEDERRRLSRELHDETAQVFSSVKLQLGLLRESASDADAPQLGRIMELVDAGMRSIRNVTNDLRPSLLDELGLVPALRALAAHSAERTGLTVSLDVGQDFPSLSEAGELAVYRALQEALANVVRHARATEAVVSLTTVDRMVTLSVRDDGEGLPADWSPGELVQNGHNGLAGMWERFAALGGEVSLESPADGGAHLVARLPVREAERA